VAQVGKEVVHAWDTTEMAEGFPEFAGYPSIPKCG
jgi:hypothetical protein